MTQSHCRISGKNINIKIFTNKIVMVGGNHIFAFMTHQTTVEISGLMGGQEFLFEIYLLLYELPFIEAQIKCKDDRNPRRA